MSYKEGIVEAITAMKDRTGSSMISIKKHMQEKLPKVNNISVLLFECTNGQNCTNQLTKQPFIDSSSHAIPPLRFPFRATGQEVAKRYFPQVLEVRSCFWYVHL